MAGFYSRYIAAIHDALQRVAVTDGAGLSVDPEQALTLLRTRVGAIRDARAGLYFCGNGASASMASHFAADWMKNAGVRATVFTDPATVTAYANDTGYDNIFSGPIRRIGTPGDALVTISSSGRSPNVVGAIEAAREVGMFVITLSSFEPDNPSRQLGDVNFYVPGATYGIAECSHQVILHAWLDHFVGLPARVHR